MTAILNERNEFICFPGVSGVPLFSVVDYPKSQRILINPDILGITGSETILKHQGSYSLGYYCDQLDVRTSQCGLSGKKCEQIPGSSIINPEKISNTLTNTNQYQVTDSILECRPLENTGELPVTFEVPYESLKRKVDDGTIGNFCPEFYSQKRQNLCQITQQPCPNFKISK